MGKVLWVVEMLCGERRKRWEPTVGVRLTRNEGRDELRQWSSDNKDDEFRLTKYVAAEPPNASGTTQ